MDLGNIAAIGAQTILAGGLMAPIVAVTWGRCHPRANGCAWKCRSNSSGWNAGKYTGWPSRSSMAGPHGIAPARAIVLPSPWTETRSTSPARSIHHPPEDKRMPSTVILEPRNDCPEMQDALQARIHDPLWLLARQWQMGEFKGDDAGSPAAAQLIARSAPISRFLPGPLSTDPKLAAEHAQNYSPLRVPLETLVEREPIRRPGQNNLRLAAETGQHFLRILVAQKRGTHRPLFRTAFPLRRPSAAERLTLDDDTLHFLDVVGQRAVDGLQLYGKLLEARRGSGLAALFNQAPLNEIPEADRSEVLQAMTMWLAWVEALFSESGQNAAWLRDRFEYSFSVSGQTVAGETVLRAPEYLEGHLDWYSFVVHPTAKLGAIGQVPSSTFCFLPTPVTFRGMPAPRLWEFEGARVNFGRVEANPQDLARLLLVEFGLVYGNDWFVIPIELDAGSLCRIGALVVANTF